MTANGSGPPTRGAHTPQSQLRVAAHEVARPRFAVCDAHNHLGSAFGGDWAGRPVEALLAELDVADVRTVVDLDGGWGDHLRAELARYQAPHPDRFVVFAGVDYASFALERHFGELEARRLRESVALGARGLKVWKTLGLHARDAAGRLVRVDDARLDPLWATAGELGVPVTIHVADPIAFFEPLDERNERAEGLSAHPEWHVYPTRTPDAPADAAGFPRFEELMEQLLALLERHPGTTFIGAHVGCCAEDLGWVGRALDAHPNFYVDTGARLAELGRQPYTARDFFVRYQDRVLFGLDSPADARAYRLYYRFFETRDEYFRYTIQEPPSQGRWMIYGIGLPDEVLRKLYYENAARVILRQSAPTARPAAGAGA